MSAVASSHDGTRVASVSRDTTVRIQDAKTGKEVATLTGHGRMIVPPLQFGGGIGIGLSQGFERYRLSGSLSDKFRGAHVAGVAEQQSGETRLEHRLRLQQTDEDGVGDILGQVYIAQMEPAVSHYQRE